MMRARRVFLGVVFLSSSVSAVAHHSYTEFDNTQSTEIDGTEPVNKFETPATNIY